MVTRQESLFQVYHGFPDQIIWIRKVIVHHLNFQIFDQRNLCVELKHTANEIRRALHILKAIHYRGLLEDVVLH